VKKRQGFGWGMWIMEIGVDKGRITVWGMELGLSRMVNEITIL
jgi:hypothetical protein